MVAAGGVAAVCLTPGYADVLIPRKLKLPTAVFVTIGSLAALNVLAAAGTLVARGRLSQPFRRDRDAWFLVGWLSVEVAGYFLLTPFPAARRVLSLVVIGSIVAARLASRTGRVDPRRRPPAWVVGWGVAAGLVLYAIDTWDALPEKVLAERAASVIPPGPHRVWYNGHWGFQYYCDRAGMHPVNPSPTVWPAPPTRLSRGDYLVFPLIPDDFGFYRPYHGGAKFVPDPRFVEPVAEFEWEDSLPAQTIPTLYGGEVPVNGRSHPRLRVVVYRVTADWTPERVSR